MKKFKKGYQRKVQLIKDENNGDMLSNSHSTVYRWENYFSAFPKIFVADEFVQPEIHTVEMLVPAVSFSEVEIVTEKLKCCINFQVSV
jgi:hypothetical protein